jgi:hypothetical protein
MPLKILYAAPQDDNSSSLHRRWALQRPGQTVVPFDSRRYDIDSRLVRAMRIRLLAGAERFREDEEAVFFSSPEECAAKIHRFLPDEPGRWRIAAAGRRRAEESGYSNDVQVRRILERIASIIRRPRPLDLPGGAVASESSTA